MCIINIRFQHFCQRRFASWPATHVPAWRRARQLAVVNKPAGVSWAMDPKGKKRKVADENRGFKAEWTESFAFIANAEGLPACLICNEKLSNNKTVVKRVVWKDIFREGMLNLQPTELGMKEKVRLQHFWRN